MSFDYFYGQQSDLFTFYRLLKRTPQELDDLFNGLVTDIKSADVLGKDTGESGRLKVAAKFSDSSASPI